MKARAERTASRSGEGSGARKARISAMRGSGRQHDRGGMGAQGESEDEDGTDGFRGSRSEANEQEQRLQERGQGVDFDDDGLRGEGRRECEREPGGHCGAKLRSVPSSEARQECDCASGAKGGEQIQCSRCIADERSDEALPAKAEQHLKRIAGRMRNAQADRRRRDLSGVFEAHSGRGAPSEEAEAQHEAQPRRAVHQFVLGWTP